MDNTPVQYLKGWVEFYKLKFKVTPAVLIPRPETELLVDAVLKFAKETGLKTILDIGTGAGNIAISIAKNSPDLQITATEVSPEALKIAKQNARFHKVEKQITFIHADLLVVILETSDSESRESRSYQSAPSSVASFQDHSFDVIVTNLPYIPSERIAYLESSVKDFEPHVALDGGENGFQLYEKLFGQMLEKKVIPKLLIGEIDYTHGHLAKEIALKYFPKAQVEVKTDLAHKQRILTIQFS